MTYVRRITEGEAVGDTASYYANDREHYGYIANYTKALSTRPDIRRGWQSLLGSIKTSMDPRLYGLATVASSVALKSSYCALAHAAVLLESGFYDVEAIVSVARSAGKDTLSPSEQALVRFAKQVARDATDVTAADIESLRASGFDDGQIFEIAAVAACRSFMAKLLDALGTLPDSAYNNLDPDVRSALVVGRPIDED